jgi:hypothetical protein
MLTPSSATNPRSIPVEVVDAQASNLMLLKNGEELDPEECLSTIQDTETDLWRRHLKRHVSQGRDKA